MEADYIITAAAINLNSIDAEEDILPKGTTVRNISPLYDEENEIVAYYVSFNPTGYAVVNNNAQNPSVVEFGEGVHSEIEKVIAQNQNAVYNNPVDVYSMDTISSSDAKRKKMYDYYPELLYEDNKVKNEVLSTRNEIRRDMQMRGDGDYGFIDWGDMPSGSYSSKTITSASSTSWITTSDTDHLASNHCGATAVTNIALYYAQRGYNNLKINGSKIDTFKAVHRIVGNGPVMTIAGKTKEYFQNRGYTLSYASVGDFSSVKSASDSNQIQGVLLADGIVSWHWILCVGYRQYNSGGNYMRVVDGWNNTINKYYKINSGSSWISATKYWVN